MAHRKWYFLNSKRQMTNKIRNIYEIHMNTSYTYLYQFHIFIGFNIASVVRCYTQTHSFILDIYNTHFYLSFDQWSKFLLATRVVSQKSEYKSSSRKRSSNTRLNISKPQSKHNNETVIENLRRHKNKWKKNTINWRMPSVARIQHKNYSDFEPKFNSTLYILFKF